MFRQSVLSMDNKNAILPIARRAIMKLGNSPKHVAEYFLYLADAEKRTLTPMQVLKLVYIAHGWQLGFYGRPLVNESVEAWQYGPVIPSLYHRYKCYGSNPIEECPAEKPNGFTPQEEGNTIEQVWKGYGQRSGISLSSLTHEPGTPWDITVKQSGLGAVISNDLIEDYYRRLGAQKQ
jgi:uncharacterized phage-associated protein